MLMAINSNKRVKKAMRIVGYAFTAWLFRVLMKKKGTA